MLFDIILVVYFFLVCFVSAKKGFIRSLIEIIGYVFSMVTAYLLSGFTAEFIYAHFFREEIINQISGQISQIASAGSASEQLQIILSSVPSFNSLAQAFGVSVAQVGEELDTWLGQGTQQAAQSITDNIVRPIIVGIVQIFAIFILFMIISAVIRVIARLIDSSIGVFATNSVNHILGAALGFGKATIVMLVSCMVVALAVNIADEDVTDFFDTQMQSSVLFSAIYYNNPLYY